MNNEFENDKDRKDEQNETLTPNNIEQEDVIILGTTTSNTKEEEETEKEASNKKTKKQKKHTSKKTKASGSFYQRQRNAILIAGCIFLSIGGGFFGTYVALYVNGSTGNTVLYQSVNTTKSNKTTNATTVSIKDIAKETMDSVVEIKTESVSTNSFFNEAVESGAGSGVIISDDGYIVTNHHVIEGANKIIVTTKQGKSYEAKLIGSDSATDLAVLKIEATNLTPAIFGNSEKLEVGDTAVAIGNPLGSLGGTVTSGIISSLDREVTIDNQKMHLLQTNAAINPGNSGGGLFNDDGELIGIVNAKSSGESIEGLGFAIPIHRAKPIITNLIENGYVKGRASLGITLATGGNNSLFQQSENVPIYIYKVESGKAADKAGLKSGDQILKINDQKITSISDVTSIISALSSGDKITMTILRDSETKEIPITLGEASSTNTKQSQ